ncbi:MAG: DUF547 domain-containing protein [Granulosicoccus sp.]|nr:DUF547 domain-containing protein [Granulosicoccus sp.]
MNKKIFWFVVALLVVALALIGYWLLFADRNEAELDARWAGSVETSDQIVDHSLWQTILDDYLVTDTDSGVNLFDYAGLLDDGRESLDRYINDLSSIDPLLLSRVEQKPYWINLYNAVTVALILDNYPLASITEIKGKVGSFGPWDNDSVAVNNIALSLNDIEHRIIRPLFNDYRIHFAVNCASIGCPSLSADVFTSANTDQLLDAAAAAFVNHPRGVNFSDSRLQLSSLFDWYANDFGANHTQLLQTLSQHAKAETSRALKQYTGSTDYRYDWSLNGYCSVEDECGL